MFLWVVLICRALKHYTRNGYSPAGLKKELESLPKDLEGFYQMMTKRLDNNLEHRALQESRKILNWTIFARRALTVAEMGDIIAIPFGEGIQFSSSPSFLVDHRVVGWRGVKHKMRHTCGDLVEIIQQNPGSNSIDENDKVQLIHQTVREFLLQDNGIAKPLNTNLILGSETIVGICARYLEACFLNEAWSLSKPRRLPTPWKSSKFEPEDYQRFANALASLPLLWYILRYVFEHTESLPAPRNRHYEAILKCFRGWENSNQKHILFLLNEWMKRRQGLMKGLDLSFSESVEPELALEFRSGCLLAAVRQSKKELTIHLCELLEARFYKKDMGIANELLIAAAASGDFALVKGLLAAGAAAECHDRDGLTPLHHALARMGNTAVVNVLLSAQTKPEQTAQDIASLSGHRAGDVLQAWIDRRDPRL